MSGECISAGEFLNGDRRGEACVLIIEIFGSKLCIGENGKNLFSQNGNAVPEEENLFSAEFFCDFGDICGKVIAKTLAIAEKSGINLTSACIEDGTDDAVKADDILREKLQRIDRNNGFVSDLRKALDCAYADTYTCKGAGACHNGKRIDIGDCFACFFEADIHERHEILGMRHAVMQILLTEDLLIFDERGRTSSACGIDG